MRGEVRLGNEEKGAKIRERERDEERRSRELGHESQDLGAGSRELGSEG